MQTYFDQKTVLLTGAAGFIGSHLTDQLLKFGARVIGVDNFITGRRVNLAHLSDNPNFRLIEADVSQPTASYLEPFLSDEANQSFQQIDLVLHFASPASPPAYQAEPIATYLVNSSGTHNLLSYFKAASPTTRFLFASTSEVYGDPLVHPQAEDYFGNVNPNGERSCYDEAKRLGETICGVFARSYQMDVRIVRIFNTYGPRMRYDDGRILPNFINQALAKQPLTVYGDGQQTRSYCFVSDLVRGILLLASGGELTGETVNLGNPDEYTVLETAALTQKIINGGVTKDDIVFAKLPSDDPSRRKPDITKALQLLNFQPEVDFRQGLEQTIAYFQTEESRQLD
jgi:nucleoside-diphosphate-sugar epimerase